MAFDFLFRSNFFIKISHPNYQNFTPQDGSSFSVPEIIRLLLKPRFLDSGDIFPVASFSIDHSTSRKLIPNQFVKGSYYQRSSQEWVTGHFSTTLKDIYGT